MILKLTALTLLACAADLAMRRTSAALRHLMWCLTLSAALLLPFGALLSQRGATPQIVIHSTIAAGPSTLLAPAPFRWVLAVYGIGVAMLLLRLLRDVMAANRFVRRSRPCAAHGVRVSEQAVVPCVWGAIIVPPVFEEWPEERQAAVVAHERAHIERHDRWTTLLARVTCAVYWFHPLGWIAAVKMRMEADRACDDAVLRDGFSGENYAAALVHIARHLQAQTLAPGAIHPSQLERRVRHVLKNEVNRGKLSTIGAGLMLVACLAVTYPLAALTQRSVNQVYSTGPQVKAPSLLRKVEPLYSQDARARKVSGTVLLSLVVGADGVAHDVRVKRGLTPSLDANAVRAIENWKFKPGTKSGRAVDVRANVEVHFRLK